MRTMTPLERQEIQKLLTLKQPVCRACGQPMKLSIVEVPEYQTHEKTWSACYYCKAPGCGITMTRPRENRNAYRAAETAWKDGMAITV